MKNIRIGIIGVGTMGTRHMNYLQDGLINGATVTALYETTKERAEWLKEHVSSEIEVFTDEDAFFRSGMADAVIIATPHYDHSKLAIKAFEHGLHVLCEKPAGVYTKQVREMNDAAQASGKVFSMMYNQRTNPLYQKLRELIMDGELGEIRRINWIITTWYRSQSYYDSGGWRATWAGEGGGVLINQCPHQLDLWQWMTGMMPERIRAFCYFGKHREIEVEDEVTAFTEYENGATGVFITTTGEAPGTNRLEIAGDRGKVIVENGKLHFWRLRVPEPEFNRTYQGGFGSPECWKVDIPVKGEETAHPGITQNFVDAIRKGTALLAPGEEGIKGLTLSNAMQLSTWLDDWVSLPINEDLYYQHLQEKMKNSSVKKENKSIALKVEGSY
ncbi:Gfo/Idh/MocA family protein [Gracilibacillus salinarum]|uniref:Gfo/Idh/MocA family oxidoreductase n=1 Tax=Gracilibacillus salinarum TaxID=2932255 RepID=A0ABY4GRQ9_9BACI|nr:Gfo/Idh/MocA family oxidoreductase [Gracilibacillus salinarum]UOQ86924.1 Gfo/Idh/MocA family oxidoreductase [Gracilibacillus salinarum]